MLLLMPPLLVDGPRTLYVIMVFLDDSLRWLPSHLVHLMLIDVQNDLSLLLEQLEVVDVLLLLFEVPLSQHLGLFLPRLFCLLLFHLLLVFFRLDLLVLAELEFQSLIPLLSSDFFHLILLELSPQRFLLLFKPVNFFLESLFFILLNFFLVGSFSLPQLAFVFGD